MARDFWSDWDLIADEIVALLRTDRAKNPHDSRLAHLIHDLTAGDAFQQRWKQHNVAEHGTGLRTLRHPLVGDITLPYETLRLSGDADLLLTTYPAAPGTPAQDAIQLLKLELADQPVTHPS